MIGKVEKDSPNLSRKKKILFSAIAFLVSCIVLELGVRAILTFRLGPRTMAYGTRFYRNAQKPAKDPHHTVKYHENALTGYAKYFPNEEKFDQIKETGEVFRVTINSQGFRGKEFNKTKPPGVTRIITLGASSTFGYRNKDDETYPHYLEELLNQTEQGNSIYEVINMGIPHLCSEQIVALFRAEALPLNPDVVTFYEGINDSARFRHKVPGYEPPPMTPGESVLRMYRGVRNRVLVLALIEGLVFDSTATFDAKYFAEHLQGKSEFFIKNISALHEECMAHGILFVVEKQQARSMTIDDVKGITYGQEVEIIKDGLKTEGHINFNELAFLTHSILIEDLEVWAHSRRVPVVDVIDLLDQDRDVLLSWVHLSPKGNRMIAESLATEIRSLLANQP